MSPTVLYIACEGKVKMLHDKTRKTLLAAAIITGTVLVAGCGSHEYADGEFDMTGNPTLACSDGLGAQLFAPADGGIATASVFRTAESAIAIAEAHEADGTYDAWYASFDRTIGPDNTTVVDVPVIHDETPH